jgi:hypothetical protein
MGFETEEQSVPEGFTSLGENLDAFEINFSTGNNEKKSTRIHYPELHFEGKAAEQLMKTLGNQGTAQITYKKVSESTNNVTRDGESKTHYRIGIAIHGLKPDSKGNEKEISVKIPKENPEDSIEKGLEAAEAEQNDN